MDEHDLEFIDLIGWDPESRLTRDNEALLLLAEELHLGLSRNLLLTQAEQGLTHSQLGAAGLLSSAASTTLCALGVVHLGYPFQAASLLRLALEYFNAGLACRLDGKNWTKFQNDQLRHDRALAIAKKHVPLAGRLWGLLSNTVSHPHVSQLAAIFVAETAEPRPVENDITRDQRARCLYGALALLAYAEALTETWVLHRVKTPRYSGLAAPTAAELGHQQIQTSVWDRIQQFAPH